MNRLADATSPYLLQHADQPVDWYPWGEEALARARAEGKPILLSIGYSACHWCHVMAHESFEDAAIAARMNRLFVNIKVDREERPDLDRIYQVAHQLLTRNGGGWPLTMFLAPDDQLPFFGGTYFPNQPRHGRPGFGDVLERVAAAWQEQRRHMTEFGASMREALAAALGGGTDDAGFEPALTARAVQKLVQSFDARLGGFGGAPKFPHPPALALLALDYPRRTDFTLRAMAAGGLVDQLGGGFYRYSTDAHWSIPHFEKMLYDNAALLALYAEAGSARDAADLRAVACDTADWLLAEMRAPEGGFHSSIDADSDGGEGAFYVWTRDEVAAVLGADHAAFAAEFGLDQPPNFADRWHLRRAAPHGDTPLAPLSPALRAARRRLYDARATRPRPATDDKILTAWNALAIHALARAGRLLGRTDYVAAASAALDFLVRVHWRDGRLLASSRHGVARLPAYLDDYAFLLAATLELLACRWRRTDFDFALALAGRLLADFADAERGGFYFTATDHERLLVRVRTFSDDALPAGNAVAAAALAELAFLTGEPGFQQAADRTLAAAQAAAREFPEGHASVLLAVHGRASARHVVLRVADGTDGEEVAQWRGAADAAAVRCYEVPADEPGLPALLASRAAQPGAALTAWVCRGASCQAPATTRVAFARALAG